MSPNALPPRARRAVGAVVIIVWLALWIAGAALVGDLLADAHPLVHMIYYAVAGIAWIIPLGPVFRWASAKD